MCQNYLERTTMKLTSFNVDERMDATLEDLKEHYNASSKAEVIRKAVALLKIAKENEQKDGSLIIRRDNEDLKVLVK